LAVAIATLRFFGWSGVCNRQYQDWGLSVDLVDRPLYLDQIEPFIDAPVVKVLTGLRRSGKSRLLELVAQRLRDRGIPDERTST
jgi:predicted AAA+ superfamily ATPase